MAMDYAQVRRDIWADEDFRELPQASQWLYLHVITSPTISYCGVADWRPARIAALTDDLTARDVDLAAVELEGHHYLVIDRDTEEVLVRSWVKHDGLMGKWNMAAALARTYGEVASKVLRGVIVYELRRLKKANPTLRGWDRDDVVKVLGKPAISPADALVALPPNEAIVGPERPKERGKESSSESPKDRGSDRASESPSERGSPTPSPSPSPYSPPIKSPTKVTSPSDHIAKRKADESRLIEVRERADKEAS